MYFKNRKTREKIEVRGEIQCKVIDIFTKVNGDTFRPRELAQLTDYSIKQIRGACNRLSEKGLLDKTHSGEITLMWDPDYEIMLSEPSLDLLAEQLNIPEKDRDTWEQERFRAAEYRGRQKLVAFSFELNWKRLS